MYFETRAGRFATDQMWGVRWDGHWGFCPKLPEELSCPHLGGETSEGAGLQARSAAVRWTWALAMGVWVQKRPRLKMHSTLLMRDTVSHHRPRKGCDFYPTFVMSSSPSYASLPFHVNWIALVSLAILPLKSLQSTLNKLRSKTLLLKIYDWVQFFKIYLQRVTSYGEAHHPDTQ